MAEYLSAKGTRQHTSAYVSMRQHPSAYDTRVWLNTSAPKAHVSIRQHTSAYVSIRQHTSAYVSIRHLRVAEDLSALRVNADRQRLACVREV